jgi:single-strand DNA-binding protein
MYNKINLIGNLTKDIELITTASGAMIAKTSIATSHKYKKQDGSMQEDVCFIDVTVFGKQAEIFNKYLHKGSKVFLEGRLAFDQWQDNNGNNRSKHSVIVSEMKMLDSKPAAQKEIPVTYEKQVVNVDMVNGDTEEIPF